MILLRRDNLGKNLAWLLRATTRRLRRWRSGEEPRVLERCSGGPARYDEGAWVESEESPDQVRIERILPRFIGTGSRVLHVGVGSSTLARRLAGRVDRIDGITLLPAEARHAEALGLKGYRLHVCDKYRELPEGGPYDLIIDNNLASFACCRAHFADYVERLCQRLAGGGRLLTEARGMRYHQEGAFPLRRRDLARIAADQGLRLERHGSVYALLRPA